MGDVAVRNPATGELRMVPAEGAQAFTDQTGWHVATQEQRDYGAKLLESGGVGQQALAAGETAVRTGTFGLAPGLQGWQQRAEIQKEEHPYIGMAAQAAGALAPALVTGGAASALGGAALGARGAAALGAAAEGLVGGAAEEIEQARAETRDVSAGNILLYGLGGELVGRALPKALSMGAGKVRRALSAVDEVAGEGLPSALAGAEARSVETEARLARDLPQGAERQAALERTAKQQYDALAPQAAEDLDGILRTASEMGDTSASPKVVERLKATMADEAPAQQNFFTERRAQLDQTRRKLREPHGEAPPEPLPTEGQPMPFDEGRPGLPGDLPEPKRKRAPAPGARPSLADAPGLGGFATRVDQIIGTGLKRLDQAPSAAEQFLISREIKQQLQGVSKKMGLVKAPHDQILHEEMRGIIDDSWRAIRDGLSDESLFGGAAKIEGDINRAWSDKIMKGLGTTEGDLARRVDVDFRTGRTIYEADLSKIRTFLKSDAIDRTITSRKLDDVLDGAEDMVRAHEIHGTWDPKKIEEQRARIARVRQARGLADEIQVAKAHASDAAAQPPKRSGLGEAADFVGENVAELFPYGGKIYRLGKRMLAMDKAGRQATRQTARKLAGVTGEAAAEAAAAAPKSGARRVVDAVTGAVKEEAKASSPAFRKAMDILEGRRAQSGAVVVEGGASPRIDRLSTKVRDRLETLRSLEAKAPTGEADELGINAAAERHADQVTRATEKLHESMTALRDEMQGSLDALTHGGHTSPDELRPKARAKYDRLKAEQDQLTAIVEKHSTKQTDAAGDYLDTDARAAAEAYLSGRRLGDTEAGNVGVGEGIKGILASPIGLTTGVGALGLAVKPAMSALERFQGDYSGPEESFEAKKKILDAEQVSPEALYETLGASLEDLPEMNPDLYQKIAARTAENVRYVRANLPPGIQTTMMYPNGTPPSQSALREFATIYNTVFDPASVLEDIESGIATGLQMKTLRESSPDLYEQLRADVVEEIGQNFRSVPLSTKLQLDILFEADGIAGPFFSSRAADMIGQSMKDDAARGPNGKAAEMDVEDLSTSAGPGGLSAIQSSVTNRGGGA